MSAALVQTTNVASYLLTMQLNFVGKLLLASCAAWLAGKLVNTKVRGSREEIDAVVEALLSSKKFQEELNMPGATVESVVDKLGLKHASAEKFERVLGIPWPLVLLIVTGGAHVVIHFIPYI